jgi:hypothetical protein
MQNEAGIESIDDGSADRGRDRGTIACIMSYLKTTFILGAGASHHTGAPLMRDFLATAMKVMDELESSTPDLYRVFDKIFVY